MAIRLLSQSGLPVELSSFVGRRRELGQVRDLLAVDRLVTLTGVGGVGKTRLATEVAQGATFDFPEGVWVVELARIGSGDLVGAALAEATAAPREAQTDAVERVARRLSEGRQLLVLDNCEHVVAAAAEVAWHLLTHCPGLTILATSREALNVRGEHVVPLLPLRLSEPAGAHGDIETMGEAMRLFADRAELLDADGNLPPEVAADVADICRHLDGLPLALELAAAWVPLLSLKQVRDRLDGSLLLLRRGERGRPERHRSIHDALDWSERLLTPPQARAFARLSVFVGGFSLDGVEAVLGGIDGDDDSALDVVAALTARSLLSADTHGDEARYRYLEPVRQYAAERLRAGPDGEEAATRQCHLNHVAELAEAAEEPIIGGPDQPWMRRLDADIGNIRAAMAWGFANDPVTTARLATALLVYCRHRGLYQEGAAWAEQAARSLGPHRAKALCMVGWLSSEVGSGERARELLDESYRLTAASGRLPDLAMVLTARALAEYVVGDLDALGATAAEAVDVARRSGSRARLMWALWAPAVHAAARGDHRRAYGLFREARTIATDLGNVSWGSALAVSIVESAIDMGETATAIPLLRRELDGETAADPSCAGYLIEDAAILAIQRGDHRTGVRLLGAGRGCLSRAGYRETPDEALRRQRWNDTVRESLESGAADALWDEGYALPVGEALDAARAVVADLAPARGTDGADDENSFTRQGDFWSLTYAGAVAHIKDSKGVRDLARLLAAPGQSLAAVDLVAAGHRAPMPTPAHGLRSEVGVGEVIDAEARAQYRARLVDLDETISDAERCNDPHRAGSAREERAILLEELGAAVGLAGRPRLALDPAERARKAVAWRLRESINHIEAVHPALGRHLRRAVRTGSFCMYDPDQSTQWRL